ncbi:hypothetical protein E2320_005638 [Naja naja]|nr:hypothetical protein E2320_005638 [Naja naja]
MADVPTGYPAGYPTAAPTYNPNIYSTTGPGYAPGYPTGTPYKVPPTQSNNAPPPYSPSPNPYQTAMYPIRRGVLHAAGLRGAASCHPSHHGGPAQQHPFCHLPGSRRCAEDQRCCHGDGCWGDHGNVCRHTADDPTTHCLGGASCLSADVPGARDPYLQLYPASLIWSRDIGCNQA